VCLFKFIVAETAIFGINFPAFDAAGASFLVGVFGGVYTMRRHQVKSEEHDK